MGIPEAAVHSLPVQLSITMNATLPARATSSAAKDIIFKMETAAHAAANADHAVASMALVKSAVPVDNSERQSTEIPIDQTAYRLAYKK